MFLLVHMFLIKSGNLSDFFNSTGFIKAIDPDEDRLEYSNNINQYKCSDGLRKPHYFNYNVSDGKYTVKVFVRLEPKFGQIKTEPPIAPESG